MKCPNCRTENQEIRKFCKEYGTKLLLVCPNCRFENAPGDKFCGECGYSLKQTKEVSPINYLEPQSYTPKHLADKILTSRSAIEGERKLVTVMFADVAGFTATPAILNAIANACGGRVRSLRPPVRPRVRRLAG